MRSLSFGSIGSRSDLISADGIGPSALHQTLIEAQTTRRAPPGDHGSPRPRNSSVPSYRLSHWVATSKRQLSPSSWEGQSANRETGSERKRMSNHRLGLPGPLSLRTRRGRCSTKQVLRFGCAPSARVRHRAHPLPSVMLPGTSLRRSFVNESLQSRLHGRACEPGCSAPFPCRVSWSVAPDISGPLGFCADTARLPRRRPT